MFLLQILLFVLGIVFGSFITALSYRSPRGISNVGGRSFCDKCKSPIRWFDNIPLISYILIGGKCRNCKERISPRYPAIELVSGIAFVLIGLNLFNLAIFCILEIIFIIDLEHQIIPDSFVFTGIGIIFLKLLFLPDSSIIFANFLAGFSAALFLLLIHLFTRGKGMGLGDVKFAVLGGLIVGLTLFPIWLFVAFLTGAVVGIILILGKKAGLKSKIAFGPFLVISIPITLLWGQRILEIMLSH